MVIKFPIENVQSFLKNRPPTVLFTLCLLIIAICTLSYAFFVLKTENVINQDAHNNWKYLLKFMDGERLCVKASIATESPSVNEANTLEAFDDVTINYAAIFEVPHNFENISNIQGYISMKDFINVCPNDFKTPEKLHISFNIGSNVSQNRMENVCVTIKGPASFLPQFEKAPCMSTFNHKNKWGLIINTQKSEVIDQNFCPDGKLGVINFNRNVENVKLHEYLSDDDKYVIYLGLMWISFTIFFVVLIIFCYALLRSKSYDV